jgi:hypothetical protein
MKKEINKTENNLPEDTLTSSPALRAPDTWVIRTASFEIHFHK